MKWCWILLYVFSASIEMIKWCSCLFLYQYHPFFCYGCIV
jgi:hypothetical protein